MVMVQCATSVNHCICELSGLGILTSVGHLRSEGRGQQLDTQQRGDLLDRKGNGHKLAAVEVGTRLAVEERERTGSVCTLFHQSNW